MTRAPSFWITAKPSTVRKFLPDCEIESYYSESELMQFGLRVGQRCERKGLAVGIMVGVVMAIAVQFGFDFWRAL